MNRVKSRTVTEEALRAVEELALKSVEDAKMMERREVDERRHGL